MEPQCTCGHVEDEHGGDADRPRALSCTVEGCDCIAFEEDEGIAEAAEPRRGR